MIRISVLMLFLIISLLASAADNPALGRWDCTSTDVSGQKTGWMLVITSESAGLSGSIVMADVTIPLSAVKLDGSALTFQFMNGEQTYRVETRIDGNRIEGKFKGPEASGSLQGTRMAESKAT